MTPHDLIAAFEVLADAPDGVKRLRELVLGLAVRGKLLQQHPEDEPAAVFLQSRVEQPEERPFELPNGWAWSSISALGDVLGGGTPSKAKPRFWSGTIPWVSPKDMKVSYLSDSQDHVTDAAVEGSSVKLIPPGAVLMVVRGMILAHSFPVAVTTVTVTVNQDMKALVPFTKELAPYLLLLFQGYRDIVLNLVERSTHGTCKLPFPSLSKLPLAVPPLAEQHRIVARVDELMGLLDRLEAARATRDDLRRKARDAALAALREAEDAAEVEAAWGRIAREMDDLFTEPEDVAPLRHAVLDLAVRGRLVPQNSADEPASSLVSRTVAERRALEPRWKRLDPVEEEDFPFRKPDGWVVARLDDVCALGSGVTKGRNLEGRETRERPYLRVANVKAGFLDLTVMKTIEVPVDEFEKYQVLPGDVLLTEGGDWDKLGRSAIWLGEIAECVHQNHIFRARPLDAGIASGWVSMFTNSPVGRAYFQSCSKQTTNLASINKTQLRNTPLPLPPAAEQMRILERVEALMALCDDLEAGLTAAHESHGQFAAAIQHL